MGGYYALTIKNETAVPARCRKVSLARKISTIPGQTAASIRYRTGALRARPEAKRSAFVPNPNAPGPAAMHPAAAARQKTPHGVAFPVHELIHMREWAKRRGLQAQILLDQVLDGAEFEELVLLKPPTVSRHAVSLWCTPAGIAVQSAAGRPRLFRGIRAALDYAGTQLRATAPRRPFFWRSLIFGP
jgi:hypothetical protein